MQNAHRSVKRRAVWIKERGRDRQKKKKKQDKEQQPLSWSSRSVNGAVSPPVLLRSGLPARSPIPRLLLQPHSAHVVVRCTQSGPAAAAAASHRQSRYSTGPLTRHGRAAAAGQGPLHAARLHECRQGARCHPRRWGWLTVSLWFFFSSSSSSFFFLSLPLSLSLSLSFCLPLVIGGPLILLRHVAGCRRLQAPAPSTRGE